MFEAPTAMSYAVERVMTVVATSTTSWEEAAQVAVTEAYKTNRDLRIAHVVEQDVVIRGGDVVLHRVKMQLTFRIDRRRPAAAPGAPDVEVSRWLIVTNQTLGTGEVVAEMERLSEQGPCEFHLLVPATHSKSYARARRLAMLAADPVTGIPSEHVQGGADFLGPDTEGQEQAQKRLDAQVERMSAAAYACTAEIGDPDPIRAILAVLARSSFDGIVLSTLPAGMSRFVKGDLPSRVRRISNLPVTFLPGKVPEDI